jgi:DNA polymerase-4
MAILHADMDAFYASVEQLDRPELVGQPVIVGGLGPRGVVSAASYEARPFGVRSAMPMVEARRLCPQGVFLSGRMERYVEVSERIREVFEEFTPIVEPLSLDEAFLDVTASIRLLGSPLEIARALKRRVREVTGLAVSVGIGPTKMVAKIASARSKPDGLLEVVPEEVPAFLRPLSIDWLWGVGPVLRQRLESAGLQTIADLADADADFLRKHFGRLGFEIQELARGHDTRRVEADRARKSIGEENTFARDVRDGNEVRDTIVAHAEAIARRLRDEKIRGRTVTLKAKLARRVAPGKYPLVTRRTTLATATDDGDAIGRAALALWKSIAEGASIRLVGVAVSGLEARDPAQGDLFDAARSTRRDALNQALDKIAGRFGEDKLVRGIGAVDRAAPTGAIKRRGPKEEDS